MKVLRRLDGGTSDRALAVEPESVASRRTRMARCYNQMVTPIQNCSALCHGQRMDEAISTTDVAGDDWEAALVAKAKGEKMDEDESEDEADEPGMADDEPPVISTNVRCKLAIC